MYSSALKLTSFKDFLKKNGSDILANTNSYEILRFYTERGPGIIYKKKNAILTFNQEADEAYSCFIASKPWRAMPKTESIGEAKPKIMTSLLERDGDCCGYCGEPLSGDATVEHFLNRTHGGSNNPANLFLVHKHCNSLGGSKTVREKIELIVKMRLETLAYAMKNNA